MTCCSQTIDEYVLPRSQPWTLAPSSITTHTTGPVDCNVTISATNPRFETQIAISPQIEGFLVVPNDTEESWKVPEYDNERFKEIVSNGTMKMSNYSRGKVQILYPINRRNFNYTKEVKLRYSYEVGGQTYNYTRSHSGAEVLAGGACSDNGRPGTSSTKQVKLNYLGPSIGSTSEVGTQNIAYDLNNPPFDILNDRGLHLEYPDAVGVRTEQVRRLVNRFDALTEAMEMATTARTFLDLFRRAGQLLLTHRKQLSKLTRKNADLIEKGLIDPTSNVAKAWLEFRYGIMPVIYSVQDIVRELAHQTNVYLDSHVTKGSNIDDGDFTPPMSNCYYYSYSGTLSFRTTGKLKFANQTARLQHGITNNPVLSVLETTPYFLILDWFVNVSDLIVAASNALTENPDVEDKYCQATRRRFTRTLFKRIVNNDGSVSDHPIKREIVASYDRTTFTKRDIGLSVNFDLSSWKRQMDLLSMILLNLQSALRRR